MTISAARNKDVAHLYNVAELAVSAMYQEIVLTPKPGLVDRANNGAHKDMDITLFMTSIAVIAPWFALFFEKGKQTAHLSGRQTLLTIRPTGLACEQAMFRATRGVNTHKGGIFSLGLLCAAAGRLTQRNETIGQARLCMEVSTMCAGLVERELKSAGAPKTRGEQLFQTLGFTGARGEAASGFLTVRKYGLPLLEKSLWSGASEQDALLRMLLALMATNPDTNVISRGGVSGLKYVQRYARRLLTIEKLSGEKLTNALRNMDAAFITRNLSPGGSADLLAVGWFLSHFPA